MDSRFPLQGCTTTLRPVHSIHCLVAYSYPSRKSSGVNVTDRFTTTLHLNLRIAGFWGLHLGDSIEDSIIIPTMAALAPIKVASTVVGFISFAITLLMLAGMHLLPFDIPPGLFCVSRVIARCLSGDCGTLFRHGQESISRSDISERERGSGKMTFIPPQSYE